MEWQSATPALAAPPGFLSAAPQPSTDTEPSPFLRPEVVAASNGRLGFALLLAATATLMIRPGDLFPALQHVPIYQTLMVLLLVLSGGRILRQLSPGAPARAITLLVLAIGVLIVISQLARGSIYHARIGGVEFAKVTLYYLLVLSWVDSPARWRRFLLALCAFVIILTAIAVLTFDGFLNLPTLSSIQHADRDPVTGKYSVLRRLCGTGIFNDPNDLGLMLIVAMAACFCFIANTQRLLMRAAWMVPVALLVYAMMLTQSRGAFLSLMGATATAMLLRYGGRGVFVPGLIALLTLMVLFSGRQTRMSFDSPDDTFQTRLDLWSEALTLFKSSPIVGVGHERQAEITGQVAHNTFMQSFAELGFVGGACMLGLFALTTIGVLRATPGDDQAFMARARPFIVAAVAGYAVGLLSLSRGDTISTYVVLALAAAYINLTPSPIPLQLDRHCMRRLAGGSVLFLACTYIFIRVMSL